MTEHMSGDPDADDRFVRLDDGDMHVVADGKPAAPALLLIHGTGASTAWWDPVVPRLADAYRVIRVDLPGHGRSSSPAGGYDIPTQARRVGAALDRLGAGRVTVIGHSTGGSVATAMAEQRPDVVVALALIDTGPSPDAYANGANRCSSRRPPRRHRSARTHTRAGHTPPNRTSEPHAGRVALVTGAARGIGQAIAAGLAERGSFSATSTT
jgi:pimeloyl-ACP methyl ester carboxylesterase